ncbi:expressed unknown protein [Seminavis robusta]|uniref:Alpha-ketoglutarate-dependent dioxygenase AlkB-like domain-containing protein n=1 Tax=Seminavis robusta TaxID=568900 RepID=A0A9N8HA33_9STRA|nr:expressed unknown protein [Seminavis robusta]|eukprot:Sro277_g106420.1 n/a (188) ;mRNA; r:77276-77839
MEQSKNTDNSTKALYPSPKTIIYDNHKSTLHYGPDDDSVYNQMIRKVNETLSRNLSSGHPSLDKFQRVAVGAIRYPAPDGSFPAHIDHCCSWVYLLSLGCSANFIVKGPEMTDKHVFEFHSGDVFCFDASTQAAILHGVQNIRIGSCPEELAQAFETLRHHRFGVQCRVKEYDDRNAETATGTNQNA